MSDTHQTLDIDRVRRDFDSLHERVCQRWGRIEVTRSDGRGGECCVLMSKAELDSMERALAILCELPGGREICEQLTRIAGEAMQQFDAPPFTPHLPGAILGNEPGATAPQA